MDSYILLLQMPRSRAEIGDRVTPAPKGSTTLHATRHVSSQERVHFSAGKKLPTSVCRALWEGRSLVVAVFVAGHKQAKGFFGYMLYLLLNQTNCWGKKVHSGTNTLPRAEGKGSDTRSFTMHSEERPFLQSKRSRASTGVGRPQRWASCDNRCPLTQSPRNKEQSHVL